MLQPSARARLPLLALVGLTLLLTWPTAATLRTHAVDRQDPLLNAWIMAWEARQILVDPLHLYDANIFFPLRHTLAFSETLLSTSALVMPLQWFWDDALLSHNVAFLLAFWTTALGAYLLALYHTGRRGAALVAAVAFAWSPYRMGQISQVQLLAFGWLPLALIYLDRLLRGAPRRAAGRWRRDTFLFALFLLLQALASFYAALFSAVACLLYTGGWLVWKRRLPRSALMGGVLAAGGVALILVPLALPYFQVQRTLGAGWTLEQNVQFSASLQAYAYAPEQTVLWGPLTRSQAYVHGPCCPASTLFPGLTLLALAGVALWRGGGRGRLWVGLGAVAFLLSLGPLLTVRAGQPTGLMLPYSWLWEHVPGFSAIRAPVRWVVLLTLALAMLAAAGLSRWRGRAAPLVALCLLLIEFAAIPLRLVPAPEAPPSLAWLDAQPPTLILELPLVAERPRAEAPPDQPRLAWERSRLLEAQLFSTVHWHSTPDGYSGYVPARHGDFAREVDSFPSPRSVAFLRGLGVRYVVVHEEDVSDARAARLAAPLPEGVSEVARFGADRVLEVAPADHPGLPESSLPLDPASVPAGGRVTLPVLLRSPQGPYVPVAGEPMTMRARWSQGGAVLHEESVLVPWPMIVEGIALLRVPLALPPPGTWALTLSSVFPEGRGFEVGGTIQVAEGAPALPHLLPVTLGAVTQADERTLRLDWRSREPLLRYYSLSAELLAPDGSSVARLDGWPGGEVPTLTWQPGVVYAAAWRFELPPGTDLAPLRLRLRWYDPEGGPPLHLWDGSRFADALEVPVGSGR